MSPQSSFPTKGWTEWTDTVLTWKQNIFYYYVYMFPSDAKILIADDMPTIRDLLKSQLKAMNFNNIIEANDGEHANCCPCKQPLQRRYLLHNHLTQYFESGQIEEIQILNRL